MIKKILPVFASIVFIFASTSFAEIPVDGTPLSLPDHMHAEASANTRASYRVANVAGTYSGTVVKKKVKSFKGFSCSATESFPVVLQVTQSNKKVSVILNNFSKLLSGRVQRKKFSAKASYQPGDETTRTFIVRTPKVKQSDVTFFVVEKVKKNGRKACLLIHKGVLARS